MIGTSAFENVLRMTPLGYVGAGLLGAGATAAVAPAVLSGIQKQRREEGKSGLMGGRPGDASPEQMKALEQQLKLIQQTGIGTYGGLSPIMNQNAELAMQRQMQLNQQLGQITGGLNQQKYTAQLAGGAQQQQTQMLSSMLQNQNPYAASAFNPNVNVSY